MIDSKIKLENVDSVEFIESSGLYLNNTSNVSAISMSFISDFNSKIIENVFYSEFYTKNCSIVNIKNSKILHSFDSIFENLNKNEISEIFSSEISNLSFSKSKNIKSSKIYNSTASRINEIYNSFVEDIINCTIINSYNSSIRFCRNSIINATNSTIYKLIDFNLTAVNCNFNGKNLIMSHFYIILILINPKIHFS